MIKLSALLPRRLALCASLCLGCIAPSSWVQANSGASVGAELHDPKLHQFMDMTQAAKMVVAKDMTAKVTITYDGKDLYTETIPGPHRTSIGRMPMREAASYNSTIKVVIEVYQNGSHVDTFNWSGRLPVQGSGDVGFHYRCPDRAGIYGTPVDMGMRFQYEAKTYPNAAYVNVEIR